MSLPDHPLSKSEEPPVKPRRSYSTDLSDEEWEILKSLLVPEATPGAGHESP
jgi:hypothetical protein